MALVFPTSLFGFKSQAVDVEHATLRGGESLSGDEDITATDGGGRVFAEFGDGDLIDRDKVLAWRAIVGQLADGVTEMVVPFCDIRHQPYGGEHAATYGDGTHHSDGTPFAGGGPAAEADADAALRATTMPITAIFAQPLIGGEWFAIEHPIKGWRAYRVLTVDGSQITFLPPLREAIAAGTPLDFANPRCLMRQDGKASVGMVHRRHSVAAIRLIEAR